VPVDAHQVRQARSRLFRRQAIEELGPNQPLAQAVHPCPE